MKCPFCGAPDSRVVDTREVGDGIRRGEGMTEVWRQGGKRVARAGAGPRQPAREREVLRQVAAVERPAGGFDRGPWRGRRRLADLEFPGDAVLVAIIRDGTAQPPRADAALEGEDELLFVVQPEAELELAHFLAPGVQRERVVQEDDEDPVD